MKRANLKHKTEERKAHTGKAAQALGERIKMAEVVRCPYCTLDNDFRPLLLWPAWFICEQCGHVVTPEDRDFKCSCGRCLELSRAA